MITVTEHVDRAAQRVTWDVVAGVPDEVTSLDGPVHVVDPAALGRHARHVLRLLGYRHVRCRVDPWASTGGHLEYWTGPDE